jgi:hypothetical protein
MLEPLSFKHLDRFQLGCDRRHEPRRRAIGSMSAAAILTAFDIAAGVCGLCGLVFAFIVINELVWRARNRWRP